MDNEKLKKFIQEFNTLQEKYGIYVSSAYEEEIDYDWDENSYVSGIQSYLVLTDSEGNEKIFNEELLSEEEE